jgi:hypothetical protein
MQLVRRLHASGVTVDHSFDLRERIGFYEKLCLESGGIPFEDYAQVRGWMEEVLDQLDAMGRPKVLAHIDSVATNFLFIPSPSGESLRLIDWEFAGMGDPLLDIAMCAINSYYTKEQTEPLTEFFIGRTPTEEEQRIVYADKDGYVVRDDWGGNVYVMNPDGSDDHLLFHTDEFITGMTADDAHPHVCGDYIGIQTGKFKGDQMMEDDIIIVNLNTGEFVVTHK